MATTYGSFPGVKIEVAGGGITSVAVGAQEKLVLFGPAVYQNDGSFPSDGEEDPLDSSLTGTVNEPEQINARGEADDVFGDPSESQLSRAMRGALASGAAVDFLYGVAPSRFNVVGEVKSSQSGTLDNNPIWEDNVEDEANIENITATDTGAGSVTVEYDYTSPPSAPSSTDTVAVNPLTGEFNADAAPTGDYEFDYKYLDWNSAFTANAVRTGTVDEGETGLYVALTEADSVSADLETEVSDRREVFQLVNALSGALPNDNEVVTSDSNSLETDHSNYQRRDAHYDTSSFSSGSVDADYYYKFAPVRHVDENHNALGAISGVFSGNGITDPIYNDKVPGVDTLEQTFTRTEANELRDDDVIPLRQSGSVRLKDNISTAYSEDTDWERDFWRRRITDRVILIGKKIGDEILGEINDDQTRSSAQRLISTEMRQLVDDRLIEPNTDNELRWFVDVYEDSVNDDEVNIDIAFTPKGLAKRIDETVTINTN